MSKPTADTKWSLTGTKTQPTSGQKDAGWSVGQKPPAQWLNWWMDAVDQWKIWLAAFESTAHTWTATQTFNGAAGGGTGGGAIIAVGGVGTILGGSALFGTGGTGGTLGGAGHAGTGGAGTISGTGGPGSIDAGGAAGPSGGDGGAGTFGTGGAVNGATNSTGHAGDGAQFQGGSVASDAASRVGGNGLTATAGTGQAGYGNAADFPHGNVKIRDGIIDQTKATGTGGTTNLFRNQTEFTAAVQFDDTVTVSAAANITGLLNPSGGIDIPSPTGMSFLTPWTNFGSGFSPGSYNQEPTGRVYLQGSVKSATGGTGGGPVMQLPATGPYGGLRPAAKRTFQVDSAVYVDIDTSGNVSVRGYSSNNQLPLDIISFVP